jgi:5-methylcytosine-specific restriction enzyme subunit McrC
MRRAILTEFKQTAGVQLSAAEASALRRLVPDLTLQPAAEDPGRYDLTPASHVGVVRVGNVEVEIRPKIGIDRVLFLVSYALDPKAWHDEQVVLGSDDDLLEAMIPGFLLQTDRAFRRGVLQGYRVTEEALAKVKGRIRFDDQLRRHYARPYPLEVRYDDYTVDTELNRLIKAALRRLGSLRLRRPDLRERLRHAHSRLSEVSDVEYDPQHLPAFSYNRLNQHYRPAIELARLVLRSVSVELTGASVVTSAFLVDMNGVFEDFVVVALREALGVTEAEFPQGCRGRSLHLDQANRIRLEPDFSWWQQGRCVFVGDVKYKRIDPREYLHADLYQLLAYATAADLPTGLLVYAAGEEVPVTHTVPNAGKTLRIETLNVQGTPHDILRRVARIGDRIKEMAMTAPASLSMAY